MSIALTKTLLLLPKAQEPDTEMNTVTTVTNIIWGFVDAREVKDYFFVMLWKYLTEVMMQRVHHSQIHSLTCVEHLLFFTCFTAAAPETRNESFPKVK